MSGSKFRLTHSPKVSPDVARLIPDKIFELTAWATGRCNLRCHYCFVYKLYPQQPSSDMQPDVVEALIDFGLRYGSRPIRIWWFGGEPLLAFDNVIKYAVDLVLKRGLRVGMNGDVYFGLTTNCTLLTEDKVKFFARYGFGILLSIDGTKEKHDKYRVFPNGRGSFDVAWRGLQLVRKYLNPNPSIRWTVAPETVEGLANDVKWYVDQGLTNLAIDWVYEVKWYEEDLKKLRQEMYKIREYMIKWMRQGIPVMLKFVRDGVAPAVAPFRAWWKSRCGLGQGSVGVDIDGTIYPCFTPDVNVLTIDGVKSIIDVKEGDLVLTHTGRYKKVTKTMKRKYKGKIYIVHPFLLPEIRCTPEHPFYVKIGDKYYWIKAEDLAKIYVPRRIRTGYDVDEIPYLVVKFNNSVKDVKEIKLKELFDDLYYNEKTDTVITLGAKNPLRNTIPVNDEFLEFIGWFLAEGHLVESDAYIGLSFGIDEEEIAEKIKNYLEWLGCKVTKQVIKEHHSVKLITYNKVLYRLLKLLVGSNAHNKRIHPLLKMLPPNKQKILLKALFKGDGTWYRREAILSTVSKQLAFDVFEMLLRVNVVPKLKIYNRKRSWKDERFTEYRVFIYGCEGVYEIKQGKRQRGRAYIDLKKGEAYFPIFEIKTTDYDGYVYNLEVEEDESYTANLVVVHNCHRFVSTHKKELAIGHVKEGWYWDRRYGWVADWIKHPPYSEDGLERCRYCPYRVACHGGCLAVNYDLFGDIHIVPRSYCDIMQVLSEVWLPFHYLMMRENNSTYKNIYFGGRR